MLSFKGWRTLIPYEDKVDVITPVNISFRGGGEFSCDDDRDVMTSYCSGGVMTPDDDDDDDDDDGDDDGDDDDDDVMIMIMIMIMMIIMIMIMIMTIVSVEQCLGWGVLCLNVCV